MRRLPTSPLLLLAGCCLVGAGCARRGPAPVGPVVRELAISGNQALEDDTLRENLATEVTSPLPFTRTHRLDRNVWATDVQRVERLYQSLGYYQVEVEDSVDLVGRDSVRLGLRIREGEPTRVTRVQVRGLESLPEPHRQQALAQRRLHEGDVFLEEDWESLGARMRATLRALGYAATKVNHHATVDLATQQATLDIEVTPGPRLQFGDVLVEHVGPATVEPWRVREQVQEVLADEPHFSPQALAEAQARLFGLDVFGAARVMEGEPNLEAGTIPVRVEVREAPPRELSFGVGVGIEQFRQEARVSAGFTHRNFLGGLRQLRVTSLAGWAFIPNLYTRLGAGGGVTRSGLVARLEADLRQPRFFHPDVLLRTGVRLERDLQPAYTSLGGRARAGVVWRPREWLTVETAYNLEAYRLDAGNLLLTDAPGLLFGCERSCTLSYLEQLIGVDRRDDVQEPTRGYFLGLALQEGGGPLGGSFSYLRVVPEARGYVSFLRQRLTLAARLRLGTLLPLAGGVGDTPIVARFFSGGDTMRGFSARRLAPIRLVESVTAEGAVNLEPVPVGGTGLFESSLEVRYRLTESLTAASFVDAGFVSPEPLRLQPAFIANNLYLGLGAGLRYRTPVGPLRLDFGYRPDLGPPLPFLLPGGEPPPLPSRGCLGFGGGNPLRAGAPEGICSIHLSVGEAF